MGWNRKIPSVKEWRRRKRERKRRHADAVARGKGGYACGYRGGIPLQTRQEREVAKLDEWLVRVLRWEGQFCRFMGAGRRARWKGAGKAESWAVACAAVAIGAVSWIETLGDGSAEAMAKGRPIDSVQRGPGRPPKTIDASGRTAELVRDVLWVFQVMPREVVARAEAPSDGAYGLREWALEHKTEFYVDYVARLLRMPKVLDGVAPETEARDDLRALTRDILEEAGVLKHLQQLQQLQPGPAAALTGVGLSEAVGAAASSILDRIPLDAARQRREGREGLFGGPWANGLPEPILVEGKGQDAPASETANPRVAVLVGLPEKETP